MNRHSYQLLAFFPTLALSLLLVAPSQTPSVSAAVIKVLPIICLVGFLALGEGWRGQARWFIAGLCISMIGDYYLIWPKTHFLEGVAAFAVAQCLYISGHGLKGARWQVGILVHGLAVSIMPYLLPMIPTTAHKLAVIIYSLAINTVLWAAVERAFSRKDIPAKRRLCSVLGAVIFCVSDISLAFLQIGELVPHLTAQLVILSTYYIAQLFHALGAAEKFWESGRKVKKRRV